MCIRRARHQVAEVFQVLLSRSGDRLRIASLLLASGPQ
jgi:hypothetical protein